MKTVPFLFVDDFSARVFDPAFGGRSAFDLSVEWAASVPGVAGIVVFATEKNAAEVRARVSMIGAGGLVNMEVVEKPCWSVKTLLEEMSRICRGGESAAVFAFADCPFLSRRLTHELVETHEKYIAEYTFADGYPYGFAPEIIDGGTAGVLASICSGAQKELGDRRVGRGSVFAALKTDINSFEIETVLAPEDWRLYRLSFCCDTRSGAMACAALLESCSAAGADIFSADPADLSRLAIKNTRVLKTVPAFYNVAISGRCGASCSCCPYPGFYKNLRGTSPAFSEDFMQLEQFENVVRQASGLSENAVVSLSCWGEPLFHPQLTDFLKAVVSQKGLSVLIETDGQLVTEELCQKIKSVCGHGLPGGDKIIWIVSLDASTEETHVMLRGEKSSLAKAVSAVGVLAEYFPGCVYPQMLRVNENENELEQFYRFWSDGNSPSGGKVIIQKYDSFCGLLPDRKPADLSPIGRNPCWHLRRDMTILCDGSVPRCREFYSTNIVGNVFDEGIEAVWGRMTLSETEECKGCDEYYTYNF